MHKLEPIRKWSEAIAAGNCQEAIAVLQAHLAQEPASEPFVQHTRKLLDITRQWLKEQDRIGQVTKGGEHRCSFCGSAASNERKLIAGAGVFICSNCVELCVVILRKDDADRK